MVMTVFTTSAIILWVGKKDDKKENKNRHSGLRIYVMMKGLEIPACLKNVYKDLVSRQLHQLDERGPTVP